MKYKCGRILEVKTAIALDEKRASYDKILAMFLKDTETQQLFIKKAKQLGFWEKIQQLMQEG